MLNKVDHIALAVPHLERSIARYKQQFAMHTGDIHMYPEHGIRAAFVSLANTRIELITALNDTSPIAGFLHRNPKGGMHHICYDVDNIEQACAHIIAQGGQIIGDGIRTGASGYPIVFLSPAMYDGVLIELTQTNVHSMSSSLS